MNRIKRLAIIAVVGFTALVAIMAAMPSTPNMTNGEYCAQAGLTAQQCYDLSRKAQR